MRRVRSAPIASARSMKQLEFPFMIRIVPWDGQYTFTHWVAKQCFDEAAREAKTPEEKQAFDLGPFYEPEIRAWAWVLETLGVDNLPRSV